MGGTTASPCESEECTNPIIYVNPDGSCPTTLPFYDKNFELIGSFVPLQADFAWQQGVDQEFNDVSLQGPLAWIIAGVNRNNPDWDRLYDVTTAAPFALNGGGNYNQQGIAIALIDNITGDELLDVWWQKSSFKKYGVFGLGASYTEMPVSWINLSPCKVVAPRGAQYDGFMYSLSGIVKARATTYSRITPPVPYPFGLPEFYPGGGIVDYVQSGPNNCFNENV